MNESPYISSIANRYGDVDRVRADAITLNEILKRQGTNLLVDVIAEHIGQVALKFEMSNVAIKNVRDSLVDDLTQAITERT